MNLLKETLGILKDNNKLESDVKWVGNDTHKTTWNKFKEIADVNYDDGFGSAEVAVDLLIVGDNWWLERSEYDGNEQWEYKELPKEPDNIIELKRLTGNYWCKLLDLNNKCIINIP